MSPTMKSQLKVGDRAAVRMDPPIPNRVRAEPNVEARIIDEILPGTSMTIIEGPVCSHGWYWWRVQVDNSPIVGWTSEGDADSYWLSRLY